MNKHYLLPALCLSVLSACATAGKSDSANMPVVKPTKDGYVLMLGDGGMPKILDKSGNKIEPTPVKYPIKDVKEIVDVKNLTIMEVKGSHYILVQIGSRVYRYDLPH